MSKGLLSFVAYTAEGAILNGWPPAKEGAFDEGQRRAQEMLDHLMQTGDVPSFVRVTLDATISKCGSAKGYLFEIVAALI